MNNNNHISAKEKIFDATVIACAWSLFVIFIASIILIILDIWFIFSNFNTPALKGNFTTLFVLVLSFVNIFLSIYSFKYVIDNLLPCDKYIPIFVLSAINTTSFVIDIVLFINLFI